MTLSDNINNREFDKFEDVGGLTHVRTKGSGTYTPAGLRTAGKDTKVQLNASTWTALPPTALTSRNSIRIQNQSNIEIKTNYDNSVATYEGITIGPGGSDSYDITDSIIIYAKAESGTPYIMIEELS